MVNIDIVYCGDLRTRSQHGPSKTILETDAPVDNEGRGERFSPTDMVASALGSCVLTIMGIAAKKKGFDIDGARVSVEKHMMQKPERRIATLKLAFFLPDHLDQEVRQLLEKIVEICPVRKSIHPDIQVSSQFQYLPTDSLLCSNG